MSKSLDRKIADFFNKCELDIIRNKTFSVNLSFLHSKFLKRILAARITMTSKEKPPIKKIIRITIRKIKQTLAKKERKQNQTLKETESIHRIAQITERIKKIFGISNVREMLVVLAALLVIATQLGLLPKNKQREDILQFSVL